MRLFLQKLLITYFFVYFGRSDPVGAQEIVHYAVNCDDQIMVQSFCKNVKRDSHAVVKQLVQLHRNSPNIFWQEVDRQKMNINFYNDIVAVELYILHPSLGELIPWIYIKKTDRLVNSLQNLVQYLMISEYVPRLVRSSLLLRLIRRVALIDQRLSWSLLVTTPEDDDENDIFKFPFLDLLDCVYSSTTSPIPSFCSSIVVNEEWIRQVLILLLNWKSFHLNASQILLNLIFETIIKPSSDATDLFFKILEEFLMVLRGSRRAELNISISEFYRLLKISLPTLVTSNNLWLAYKFREEKHSICEAILLYLSQPGPKHSNLHFFSLLELEDELLEVLLRISESAKWIDVGQLEFSYSASSSATSLFKHPFFLFEDLFFYMSRKGIYRKIEECYSSITARLFSPVYLAALARTQPTAFLSLRDLDEVDNGNEFPGVVARELISILSHHFKSLYYPLTGLKAAVLNEKQLANLRRTFVDFSVVDPVKMRSVSVDILAMYLRSKSVGEDVHLSALHWQHVEYQNKAILVDESLTDLKLYKSLIKNAPFMGLLPLEWRKLTLHSMSFNNSEIFY